MFVDLFLVIRFFPLILDFVQFGLVNLLRSIDYFGSAIHASLDFEHSSKSTMSTW
jgi:hypothetical protein